MDSVLMAVAMSSLNLNFLSKILDILIVQKFKEFTCSHNISA